MNHVESPTRPTSPARSLEDRLSRGADLLFDMEQRGDTGTKYQEWLSHWQELLGEYEAHLQVA